MDAISVISHSHARLTMELKTSGPYTAPFVQNGSLDNMINRNESFDSSSVWGAKQTKKQLSAEALTSQRAFYCCWHVWGQCRQLISGTFLPLNASITLWVSLIDPCHCCNAGHWGHYDDALRSMLKGSVTRFHITVFYKPYHGYRD